MDWAGGYVTDVEYTSGYYRELAPTFQGFVLLAQGMAQSAPKQPRYLELGFGQGLSLLIHAAATPGEYWGTDFNPAHAAAAQELADAGSLPARLFDQSFEELAVRSDLPQFDAIALHGIWSWVSPANRHIIVELLRRHLKPGGTAYVSYNTLPGWGAVLPLRHLMTLHARLVGHQSRGIHGRVDAALAFAKRISEAGSRYFQATPDLSARLERMSGSDRDYLAHEYFNADWHPMHFSELAGALEGAKLSFAASAHLVDYFETRHMDEKAQAMLRETENIVLRETVRDFIVNQQFRRDLFVRGVRKLSNIEHLAALRSQRLVTAQRPQDVVLEHSGQLGKLALSEQVFRPILEALASAPGPLSIAELARKLNRGDDRLDTFVPSLVLLVGKGAVLPAQSPEVAAAAASTCRAMNEALISLQRGGRIAQALASPVTGTGIPVNFIEQQMLTAGWAGKRSARDLAQHAIAGAAAHGRAMTVPGKTLRTPEEALPDLIPKAQEFIDHRLPILKRLGIA